MSGSKGNKRRGKGARRKNPQREDAKTVEPTLEEAEPAKAESEVATKSEPEPDAAPVVPRTNTSTVSAAAIEQALAASATSESPEKPSEPQEERTTVEPHTLREASAADLISLPRTMSEEWMSRDADDGAYEVSSGRPRWIVPAIVAGVAAVGVVAVLALGGDKGSSAPARVVANEPVVHADAEVAVAVVPVDAAEVVVTPDAAEVAMVPIDAPQVVPDAAVPADAAVVAVAVDAAVPKPTPDTVATNPATTDPDKKPTPKPPKDERTIEQLIDAREFAKANTACASNTLFSTPRLVACAIAACTTKSAPLAARWIRAIPKASRDEIVDRCKSLGLEVAIP